MIKFFRKIRQRLLTENKLSKYLIYGFGEIVLVVIGILIALSINKYNENIKAKQFELKLLKQIEQDVLENRIEYERLSDEYEKQFKSCEYILKHIREKLPLSDSLIRHFAYSRTQIKFTPINTSYAFLKSAGLNAIKNDSTRIAITKLYEYDINMMVSQNDRLLDIQTNQLEPFLVQNFKVNSFERESALSEYKTHYLPFVLPINYDALCLNEAYANILALKLSRLAGNRIRLNEYQENLERVITLLRKEIEKMKTT